MKILMPSYIPWHNADGSQPNFLDATVSGGIEKFMRDIYLNFQDEIIPVVIYKDQIKDTWKIIGAAVNKHKPDVIFLNRPAHYKYVKQFDLPIVFIDHRPVDRPPQVLSMGDEYLDMLEYGVHIYFVSERQFAYHQETMKKKSNVTVTIDDIKGFAAPSFITDTNFEVLDDRPYDIVTIGRNDRQKDPFFVHKINKDQTLHSLVMTNDIITGDEERDKYAEKSLKWTGNNQTTLYNLPHDQVMNKLAQAKVYVSTCPQESWGITALEALSRGVPVILCTDSSNMHSSQEIAADPSHIRLINKGASTKEYLTLIEELSIMSCDKRKEISEMTVNKHSKENWIKSYRNMFDLAATREKRLTTLEELF